MVRNSSLGTGPNSVPCFHCKIGDTCQFPLDTVYGRLSDVCWSGNKHALRQFCELFSNSYYALRKSRVRDSKRDEVLVLLELTEEEEDTLKTLIKWLKHHCGSNFCLIALFLTLKLPQLNLP